MLIIALGIAFGLLLQYAKVNSYNTISGMAILEDFTVAKTISATIGIGIILLMLETKLGLATYHLKPFFVGSILLGGILFGIGMAILGYCPGTMPVSIGQGSVDAMIGFIGGLAASLLYTILSPSIHEALGPNLGKITLGFNFGNDSPMHYLIFFATAALFIGISFWLQKIAKTKDTKWLVTAFGIALITAAIFAISDRVLGASTFDPYAADQIVGFTDNSYFQNNVEKSGFYEMKFLFGAFLAGLIPNILKGNFKLILIHENWLRFKGESKIKRIFWSFIGGFILLFGARLAGGCTSGHIISGGMQLAISSLFFAIFV
ncbi:MAG TPA: YeeE/YedE thiosulfate transporter family protein, partial [Sediminibacterium sp.]|nr:YeeE/YedE thiosulfate transporter family protein [Sediminibacterium sp.]